MNPELVASPVLVRMNFENDYRQFMLSIPFAHAEFRTESREYLVMLMIPSIAFYNTIKLITEFVDPIEVDFHSMEYSGKFTLHCNLYEAGRWINAFNTSLEKLIEIIKTKNSKEFRRTV